MLILKMLQVINNFEDRIITRSIFVMNKNPHKHFVFFMPLRSMKDEMLQGIG